MLISRNRKNRAVFTFNDTFAFRSKFRKLKNYKIAFTKEILLMNLLMNLLMSKRPARPRLPLKSFVPSVNSTKKRK